MWALAHSLLLGVAVVALADAALRVASLAVPGGLLRVVAAAPLTAAAAVLWALALGLVGLGTSPAALTLAAVASAVAARVLVTAPAASLTAELRRWWRGVPTGGRLAAGALAGLAVAQTIWMWRHPWIGADGLSYHLPDALAWLRDGHPGSQHTVLPLIPVQNYAMTYEVLLSWVLGISRGYAALAPLQLGLAVLMGAAAVVGLEALGVPRQVRWLAAATVVTLPIGVEQFNSVANDLPTASWMVVAAALCASAPRRPALLAVALLAASLSVGTKSTAAVAGAIALVIGAVAVWRIERRFPAMPLILAACAAVAVGGVWYIRNLAQHGSPLWPLVAAPGGTPKPYFLTLFDRRFLDVPGKTLSKSWTLYQAQMAGGLAVMAAVPLVMLWALVVRRRRALAAAAAAVLLVVVWAAAPYTGVSRLPVFNLLAGSTIRYILPALIACTLAVALAAGLHGWPERIALAVLVGALGWNLYQELIVVGAPYVAGGVTLALGAVGGALVAVVLGAAGALARPVDALAPALAVVSFAVLTPAASGFVARHGAVNYNGDGAVVRWFAARPGFMSRREPVSLSPILNAMLAGDRLTHPTSLLGPSESCPRVLARARSGWVVVTNTPFEQFNEFAGPAAQCLASRLRPVAVALPSLIYGGAG